MLYQNGSCSNFSQNECLYAISKFPIFTQNNYEEKRGPVADGVTIAIASSGKRTNCIGRILRGEWRGCAHCKRSKSFETRVFMNSVNTVCCLIIQFILNPSTEYLKWFDLSFTLYKVLQFHLFNMLRARKEINQCKSMLVCRDMHHVV